MATALATSIVITVVLLLLVILAMTGKRLGTTRATAALVGVGYGLLLLVSITGAGVDLFRALGLVLLVAIVYPMVFFTRGTAANISRTVRGIVALILAAALLALVAHMLSLIGWVLIPAAVIALAVGAGAMAVLGSERGTSRVARWGYWITLVLSWLMAALGAVIGGAQLPSGFLAVDSLPQGIYIAMALGVLALASVDPLLRQSVKGPGTGFPVGGFVLGIALIAGILAAPLLIFGGSFFVPSLSVFIGFGFMPAGAIGVFLALGSLAIITLIPCYIAVAGKMLAQVVRLDGTQEAHTDDEVEGATAGSMIMAALVAGSLAIAVSSPSVLVVVASLIAAAAGGAALSGIRPGLHVLASLFGAVVGVIPAAFTGGVEFFAWNLATAIGIAVAAVAGAVTAVVLGRAGSASMENETASEVTEPVI